MGSFFQELRGRRVFRVAAVYAVVSWVIIQVVDTLFPALQLPEWTITFITVLLILGFFPTMVMAWAYQRSAEGIKPHEQVQAAPGSIATSAQPINYLILVVVLVMVGVQLGDRLLSDTSNEQPMTAVSNGSARVVRSHINLGYMDTPDAVNQNNFKQFEFTPDGSSVIYRSIEDGMSRLYERDIDSLVPKIVAESERPSFFFPKISPDGSRIVFQSAIRGGSNRDLYLFDRSSGTSRLIDQYVISYSVGWLDGDTLF